MLLLGAVCVGQKNIKIETYLRSRIEIDVFTTLYRHSNMIQTAKVITFTTHGEFGCTNQNEIRKLLGSLPHTRQEIHDFYHIAWQ